MEFPCDMIQAMGLETFTLSDFSGGINVVDDPQDLDPTEMAWPGTNDIEIVGKGARIRLRNGMKKKSSSGTIAPTTTQSQVRNIAPYRAPGAVVDNAVMSTQLGRILTWTNSTQAINEIQSATTTAGNPDRLWYFEQAADAANTQYVWCLDGIDAPKKFPVATGVIAAWAGAPPNGKFCKVWKNMMIVSGVTAQPQRLYFSTIANPESWPANNFIDIKSTDDEDDSIIALEVIGENLVVFKQNSVWVVFDAVTFDNRRLSDTGCVNRFAHCSVGETVYWVSPTGIFSTDGDEVNHESKNVDVVWSNTAYGNIPLTDARMASIHDTVYVCASGNYLWYMKLDLERPDKQHPWMFNNSGRVFYNNAMCTGNWNSPASGQAESLMLVLQDSSWTEQTLFEWGAKYGASDDEWTSAFPTTLIGGYVSKRLALLGTEAFERIRRINLYGISANLAVNVIDSSGSAVFSQYVSTDNGPDFGYARVRPEVRARGTAIWLTFLTIEPTAGEDPHEVTEIEIKYRGGKEH